MLLPKASQSSTTHSSNMFRLLIARPHNEPATRVESLLGKGCQVPHKPTFLHYVFSPRFARSDGPFQWLMAIENDGTSLYRLAVCRKTGFFNSLPGRNQPNQESSWSLSRDHHTHCKHGRYRLHALRSWRPVIQGPVQPAGVIRLDNGTPIMSNGYKREFSPSLKPMNFKRCLR